MTATYRSDPPTLADVRLDPEDAALLEGHRWIIVNNHGRWYCQRGDRVHLQRLVMNRPAGARVIFRNGDRLDCRRANLAVVSPGQANARQGLGVRNTSGYKGVTRDGTWWRASLKHHGHRHYLGLYRTARLAALAYDKEARNVWGRVALTNKRLGLLRARPPAAPAPPATRPSPS